jgi:hypothetical protein
VTMQVTAFEERCVITIVKLVGIGTILASAELLSLHKVWSRNGLFSWAVTRTCYTSQMRSGSIIFLDAVCDDPQYTALLGLEMLCGVALLLNIFPNHMMYLLLAILFVHLLTFLRNLGTDGADQMQTLLLVSLACYYATPDPLIKRAAIGFIALQTVLAYFTAGIVKFWSSAWLKGTVLRESLALGMGSEAFYKWMPKSSRANQLLCLSVVAYECLFPLSIVLKPSMSLAVLGAGVLLHLTNAFALGLPRFLFTFVAAYPAVFWVTCNVQSALHGIR